MAPAAKGTRGFAGLGESDGKVGFPLWPRGQYAVQVEDASDDQPTRGGDYMLKLRMSIIGVDEQAQEALGKRDANGKTIFKSLVVPAPGESWYQTAIDRLANACKAFGVKIKDDWYASAKGCKDFIGRKAALNLAIGKDKDTGEDTQLFNGFVAFGDKGCHFEED